MSLDSGAFSEDHNADRLFIPKGPKDKPSDIFENVSCMITDESSLRFRHKSGKGYLIFVSGRSYQDLEGCDRAIYACVWGPHQFYHRNVGDRVYAPNDEVCPVTAESAQIFAATLALDSVSQWYKGCKVPSKIVLAYSGDYFLDQVVRSNLVEQVQKEGDNLGLKFELADSLEAMKEDGIKVQFWQIDKADNLAEKAAQAKEARLSPSRLRAKAVNKT